MKTSFYFVLWILIYPLLGLFNNKFINDNSFIVALAVVWGLSWLLNRTIPDTLVFERASEAFPVLEEVYIGNVASFRKRLSREMWIEIITAIYFCVTTVVIAFAVLWARVDDWIALIVFGALAIRAVSQSGKLIRAYTTLKLNPVPEQCAQIVDDAFNVNYAVYYEERHNRTSEDMLPSRPRHFKVFQWFSIIVAAIAAVLGIIYIIPGAIIMLTVSEIEAQAIGCMYFLYGSLAIYFGAKDFVSILQSMRKSADQLYKQKM